MIEKTFDDRSAPAEICRHIVFIRDQLETYEADAALHTEHEKRIQQLETANSALLTEKTRRESEDAKGFSGWGGQLDQIDLARLPTDPFRMCLCAVQAYSLKGLIIMNEKEKNAESDKIPDITLEEQIEADMGAEEILGHPLKRTAVHGIANMQERIAYLRRELANIHPNAPDEAEIGLIRDIADAEARLKEYQTQYDSRN